MNEGDIATVFCQYGEVVDVHLVRDKKTGKSKGFAFLAYEDQRSTIVAVDNLNNAIVCGRNLRVDHVNKFRPPKEFLEIKEDDPEFVERIYRPSGPDGRGWGDYRNMTEEEQKLNEEAQEESKEEIQKNIELKESLLERAKQVVIDEDERVN